jgi:hypothetical protein
MTFLSVNGETMKYLFIQKDNEQPIDLKLRISTSINDSILFPQRRSQLQINNFLYCYVRTNADTLKTKIKVGKEYSYRLYVYETYIDKTISAISVNHIPAEYKINLRSDSTNGHFTATFEVANEIYKQITKTNNKLTITNNINNGTESLGLVFKTNTQYININKLLASLKNLLTPIPAPSIVGGYRKRTRRHRKQKQKRTRRHRKH